MEERRRERTFVRLGPGGMSRHCRGLDTMRHLANTQLNLHAVQSRCVRVDARVCSMHTPHRREGSKGGRASSQENGKCKAASEVVGAREWMRTITFIRRVLRSHDENVEMPARA
jgi:hypothetical protein